jgi:ATP-dependent exoDNAse (exonuclease V) beta subunit
VNFKYVGYIKNMVDILKKLEMFNDPEFKFDPVKHKYTLDDETFISVTQFISRFHKPFETDFWSKEKAKKAGVSQEEILLEWKELNDRANDIGTQTHNWIENYYNRIFQDLPSDIDVIDRINKFNIAHSKWLFKLKPLRLEQRIFSRKLKIAGMMDALFTYNDNVFIVDWKTNKKFTHDYHEKGRYEKLLYPFNDFWKNHLNEYSIQVSLYKLILKEIGIDIKACYLLHIGPDAEAYVYKAHDLTKYLEEYFKEQTKDCNGDELCL